jgi:hypothetical protein
MACVEKPVEIWKVVFSQETRGIEGGNAYSLTTAEPIRPFAPVMKTRMI